jgi:tetratricopeptide (TPR) repeat protein
VNVRALSTHASAALLALAVRAAAQDATARVPVTVVEGRLVVACQVSATKRIAANLFVDYEAPFGLLLHNRAAAGIEAEGDDGSTRPITVHLPDLNVMVEQRAHGDEEYYERFTKWNSKELGENAVVGTLGAQVLAGYHVVFDLAAGFIELSPPRGLSAERRAARAGETVVPVTIVNDAVWLPVAVAGRRTAALQLSTAKYETWIDAALAEGLGHPAGDVAPVLLGALDIARYVPLRPEDARQRHPDGVFGRTGLDLLRHFRVEIDRVNRWTSWTETAPAQLASAEQAFYRARLTEDPEAIESWLREYPGQRLVPEASELLLDMRLAARASDEQTRRALELVHASRPADLKTTGALELVRELRQSAHDALALAAGELGIASAREDRYPDAVHRVHAALGAIRLQDGDRRAAWKHLLSAAFGLPEDGPLNLDLARCYEQEGRLTRAYSRYLQALLSPESGLEAIDGLERVQPKLPDAESFSVDVVERLIEGRVEGFGAATKFAPEEPLPAPRCVALEYFTNAHFPFEIGVTLARDGLRDHFGREFATQITYSIAAAELDPLVNPLSDFMGRTYAGHAFQHRADGVVELPEGARSRFKQEVYDICRAAVVQRLAIATEHEIEIEARADRQGIRGLAEFRGPADDLVAQLMLVERGVLFPGRSKVVIHRNVARAALTEDLGGVDYAPRLEKQVVEFDRTFEAIRDEIARFLDEREAAGEGRVSRLALRIDPRQASVVALLRRRDTGEVVQSAMVDAVLPEDLR